MIGSLSRSITCVLEADAVDEQPRLFSTKEAAARLELHEGHVRRLAKRLDIGLLIGKQRVFTDADLERLRARNTRPGTRRRQIDAGNS